MPDSIGLSAYNVTIYKSGDVNAISIADFETLQNVTLIDFVYDSLLKLETKTFDVESWERVLAYSPLDRPSQAHIKKLQAGLYVFLEYGKYGYSAKGKDAKTNKQSYLRTKKDAEYLPMYLQVYVPKVPSSQSMIMLMQNRSMSGIKMILERYLSKEFRERFKGYRLYFSPLIDRDIKLALLKHSIVQGVDVSAPADSPDVTDKLVPSINNSGLTFRATITGSSSSFSGLKAKVTDFLSGKGVTKDQIVSSDADTVKLIVSYRNGASRVIDLFESLKAPRINITDDISFDAEGHPNYSQVHSVATGYMKDLFS